MEGNFILISRNTQRVVGSSLMKEQDMDYNQCGEDKREQKMKSKKSCKSRAIYGEPSS